MMPPRWVFAGQPAEGTRADFGRVVRPTGPVGRRGFAGGQVRPADPG
ncbi:hypothetical protein [Frankia tisae]|nr:hypothetical protein [Frankia tisae]